MPTGKLRNLTSFGQNQTQCCEGTGYNFLSQNFHLAEPDQMRNRFLVVLLAVLMSFAMSGVHSLSSVAAAQDAADGSAAKSEQASVQVKVLDAGAAPRRELRYKFSTGDTEKMLMDMDMSMAVEFGGRKPPKVKIPKMRMKMSIADKKRTSAGLLQYSFKLDEIEVVAAERDNPAVVNQMKQQLKGVKGLSGSASVSPRGLTSDLQVKIPAGASPQLKQMMENMKQSMQQMSAPFPVEAVGIGATWETTMKIPTPAFTMTQVATYKLISVQGATVKFEVSIKQTAEKQKMKNVPGVPANVKLMLESLNTQGKGTMEIELDKLSPKSELAMKTVNVISTQGQTVKTTMGINITMHP
jgi:hypothetical protein